MSNNILLESPAVSSLDLLPYINSKQIEKETKFSDLTSFYRQKDKFFFTEKNFYFRTGILGGFYVPSRFADIKEGLDKVIGDNLIDVNGWFCDMGSGDGRIVSLTSSIYNIPSFGVEYESSLINRSNFQFSELRDKNLLNGVPCNVYQGNFLDDDPFDAARVSFGEVKTFFNYVNNQIFIAERFLKEASDDSVFLLHKHCHDEPFSLTRHIGLKMVADYPLGVEKYKNDSFVSHLFVFKKP